VAYGKNLIKSGLLAVLAASLVAASLVSPAAAGGGKPTPPSQTGPTPKPVTAPGLKPKAGLNFNCMQAAPGERTAVYARLASLGVTWVRINFNWFDLQPANATSYDSTHVSMLDDCVQQAHAAGLQVLVVFLATPSWANGGAAWNAPPSDPKQYASALAWLASRYRGTVGAWEVWNEENWQSSWSGTVASYVALLKASYTAVKQADPGALVVFGGTAYNDDVFLRRAYAAGAQGSFDVMATHPYDLSGNSAPETADNGTVGHFSHAAAVHTLMAANGDGSKPIWFTELGWSAPNAMSPTQQADYLRRAYTYAQNGMPYVTNLFWFQAVEEDPNVPSDSFEAGLALMNPDLSPRPALTALGNWIHSKTPRV
jgi:hypothetical protein